MRLPRVFCLAALASVGLGAWLGMHADTARFSAAAGKPAPVERVACTSVSGSCGGYAGWHDTAKGTSFTRVTGTLTIPHVDCAKSQYLTTSRFKGNDYLWSWLGLGGDPGPTVGQAGILLVCVKGQPYPQIWEWTTVMTATGAPIDWHRIPGVMTGDQVYVSVRARGSSYLFNMRIPAVNWSLSTGMPCPVSVCVNNTAEAVLEAVAHDNVPAFTSAHFSGIHVWARRINGTLTPSPAWVLCSNTVARPGGGVLISRGRLSGDGTAFTPEFEGN